MFSTREVTEIVSGTPSTVRVAVLVTVLAATLIGAYAYLAPASDAAAVIDHRPHPASTPTIPPRREYLPKDALDANGIELDLDGNASALIAADQWCGRPACGNPR